MNKVQRIKEKDVLQVKQVILQFYNFLDQITFFNLDVNEEFWAKNNLNTFEYSFTSYTKELI